MKKGMTMKMKLTPLLMAIAVLGAFPFASTASATGWEIDTEGELPLQFSVAGGMLVWTTPTFSIACGSVTGTGQYDTPETGKIELTFHECITGLYACTTPGQPAGTVKTPELEFHNVYLESGTNPGILITSSEGIFASLGCAGFITGFSGNGIFSELTWACGEPAYSATALYESSSQGVQKWMQIETEGVKRDLSMNFIWGNKATLAFDGSTKLTFAEKAEMTC